jgi:hypothetical protein
VEFWPNQFVVEDMRKNFDVVIEGILDSKEKLFKIDDFPRKYLGLTTLIVKTSGWSKVWHERLGHMNFQSMKLMVKHDIFTGLLEVFPLDDTCDLCALGNHHQVAFETRKA